MTDFEPSHEMTAALASGQSPQSPIEPHLRPQTLAGKLAIVLDAGRGIPRVVALDLASRGANILGTYTSNGTAGHQAHLIDVLAHTVKKLYATPGPFTQGGNPPPTIRAADLSGPEHGIQLRDQLRRYFPGVSVDMLIFYARPRDTCPEGQLADQSFAARLIDNVARPLEIIASLVKEKELSKNVVMMSILPETSEADTMDLVVRNSIMTMSDHLPKDLVREDPYYEEVRLRNVVVPQDQAIAARMVATTLVREL